MKNSIDFHKINGGIYRVINFNNMFPILNSNCYQIINIKNNIFKTDVDIHYINLLKNQLVWLNKLENKKRVIEKANALYENYINNKLNPAIKNRCCNFKLLEQHYQEYEKHNSFNSDIINGN